MGLDLNALFGQAEQAATQGFQDFKNTIGNTALGFAESQGAGIIQAAADKAAGALNSDSTAHQASAQSATQEILQRPTASTAWSAYLQNTFQSPIMKQYGPYIIVGVAAIVGLTLYARRI